MPPHPEDDDLREMPPDGIFSVAFSFAGEQRALVRELALRSEELLGRGKVFYDNWFPHIIGGEGVKNLREIFTKAQLIVVCISQEYASKNWPASEWRVIEERIHEFGGGGIPRERMPVLPIRVGDGDFEGVRSTDITFDARHPDRRPEKMAEIITHYLRLVNSPKMVEPMPVAKVLILPCAAHLNRVRDDLAVWLEQQRIAVLNLDRRLPQEVLDQQADEMIGSADVIVRWLQSASSDTDAAAIACHDRVVSRKIEGEGAALKTLRWIPDDASGLDGANADTGSRKMRWEEFKREVFEMAVAPPSHRIVIGAAAVDRQHVSALLAVLERRRQPRDTHYDKLHLPVAFPTDPDFDNRILKAIRKRTRGLVVIQGDATPDWIVERLRAYDLFRETMPDAPQLVVWRLPAANPRPPLDFFPDEVEEVNVADPDAVLARVFA